MNQFNIEFHSMGSHSIARVFLIFISWTGFSYTTQYAKKKKNLKKEQSRALRDDIHGGLPIEILTPPERA